MQTEDLILDQRRRPRGRAAVAERLLRRARARQVQGPRAARHPPRPTAPTRGSSRARRSPASASTRCRAGRPRTGAPIPPSFDQVRPGCYDVHERIRDMNVNGVLASINFPSWPGLGGQFFAQNDDNEFVGRDDPRLQRLAPSRVVRRVPGPLHPARALRLHSRRRLHGRGDPPHGRPGLSRGVVPRRAAPLRHARPPRRRVGPGVAGVPGHRDRDGVPLRRHAQLHAPHAVRRDPPLDAVPDRDLRVGAAVVADPAQVPDRQARARRGRHRLGARTSSRRPTSSTTTTTGGPAPTSATSSRARCSASTCRPASSTTTPGCATASGSASTRSRGSATTRTPTPPGRSRPK